jgi:RNA polymerase sigma factor (sigma-70 family)
MTMKRRSGLSRPGAARRRSKRLIFCANLDAVGDDAPLWGGASGLDEAEAREGEALRDALVGALTSKQREVIEMHFFEGLSQGEIARRLGVSQQVVQKRLHGDRREGKLVGGALPRLREALAERFLRP